MKSKEFKEALLKNDLELLRKIPKGDVHSHSGLGMRFSTFNEWCGGNVTPPPSKMKGISGIDNYIFGETAKYVSDRKGFEFLTEGTIKEAINDGVTLLETSIDCNNMMHYENAESFFKYIKSLVEKYSDKIDFRPEVGIARPVPVERWESKLMPCIDSGIFKSLDLYGSEEVNNLELYKPFYDYANKKKIKTKVHVGEFCDCDQLIKTIEALNPCEIQHGLSSINNPKAIDMIKERNIRLNICPSSNVILGAVESIEKHPLRELFNKELLMTINTDDLLLFNSGVSEEFLYVYNAGLLDIDELNEIRLNAFK